MLKLLNPAKFALLLTLAVLLMLAQAGASGAATRAATQASTAPAKDAPTATATLPTIADAGYEILFPSMIRFFVVLRLSVDNIKTARLHIFQTGFIDQAIDVPLKDNAKPLNDEAAIIYYAWPLDAQNAPLPFELVKFDWTVESTAGKSYTNSAVFTYSDPYHTWLRLEKDPLSLYVYNSDLATELIRTNVLRAYDLITRDTGSKPTFKVIVYDVGSEPCQTDPARPGKKVILAKKDNTFLACDPSNAAKVYAARGFTLIQRISPLFEQLEDQIVAVMADSAYDTFWKNGSPPPAWFRSGLFQMYGLTGHAYSLLLARDAASTDRLLTLDALAAPPVANDKDNGASLRAWNAQSYMLTLYIAARFGATAPFEIGKQIAQKSNFADAFSTVSGGVTLEALYTDWKSWLFSKDADAALRWNVYITSPTPSYTPTPTDEPTLTPTSNIPTATETNTATATLPPTRTATPITPTNTALPPGSLLTKTVLSPSATASR